MGTRGIPGKGPRDNKGFLKARVWPTDLPPLPQSAGGTAIGEGIAALDVQLLVDGGAIGIAVASATDQEAEAGSATGIATASASAQLLETAAGSGVAVASSDTLLLVAAQAAGVAVASASEQEAEQGSGAGVAIASANPQLEIGGSAIGEATSLIDLPNGIAIGVANASADPMLLASGSASGEALATAETPPAEVSADLGDGLPGYRSALWVVLPATPVTAGGSAVGGSHATAEAIEVFPVPALVITEVPPEDDDLEMMLFFELAAA